MPKLFNQVEEALDYTQSILEQIEDESLWVIPQSGGKDSRTVAQTVLALIDSGRIGGPEQIVFYMADTLGEFPSFMEQAINGMKESTRIANKIGIKAQYFITTPNPQGDFWIRVLGYGVVPPSSSFRWCTDTMKVSPARKVLTMNKWNRKPQLLGVRYGESETRDEQLKQGDEQQILSCTATGECGPDFLYFKIGKTIPKFAPIKQWRACAVWDWLTIYAPEYGFDNSELINHYNMNSWLHEREDAHKNGIDESQGLRYGCWFCPLVYNDRTAKWLSESNPMVSEMMTFTDEYLRPGGKTRKVANRNILSKMDGTTSNAMLSLEICQEMYDWMLDFETRWDHPLLTKWQKQMIEAVMGWRAFGGTIQEYGNGRPHLDIPLITEDRDDWLLTEV